MVIVDLINACQRSISSYSYTECGSQFFNKYSTSDLRKDFRITSKMLTKKVLVHNTLCFDQEYIFDCISNVLSVYIQFLLNIIKYTNMIYEFLPISGFWLNIVGEYLFDHDLYDEAIDCFEMAIARFKEYPSEAVQNNLH